MWKLIGLASKATGLGSVAITLIMLASSVAVVTGTYVLWKRSVIAERDRYWDQRMTNEKNRIEDLLRTSRRESAERIAVIEQENATLEARIQADDLVIDKEPNRDAVGLDADGVSRIDSIH